MYAIVAGNDTEGIYNPPTSRADFLQTGSGLR